MFATAMQLRANAAMSPTTRALNSSTVITSAVENVMPYRIDNIDPKTTVMIVVDMQNDFVAQGAKLQSAAVEANFAPAPKQREMALNARRKNLGKRRFRRFNRHAAGRANRSFVTHNGPPVWSSLSPVLLSAYFAGSITTEIIGLLCPAR
jgi:hypothetical protein